MLQDRNARYWFRVTIPYRFAVCNELFQNLPFAETCKQVRALGYTGLEIAPFTLGPNAGELTREERQSLRRAIHDAGLGFVGLHWLLVGPPSLHATTPDENTRRRTWEYIRSLIDLAADLADNNRGQVVVVFGSPKQRSTVDGMTPYDAVRVFAQELSCAAPHAEARGVTILLEPLSPEQTDVVTTLEEAVSIVKEIKSPAVQTMFDVHNAVREREPHMRLIREFARFIRHVHVNEYDGREPGTGDYDFRALLATLGETGYSGWISLEAFDFSRDPFDVAQRAIHHLRAVAPPGALTQTI
ncbi:MAG TPA: sugar phosphate isomerase/epimerase family protein [Bryobacteraceae bacterium]